MKLKFFVLTFLLLFARGCDFYSTSLWFFDDPSGETNPLSRYLGFGWTGLVVSNIILCSFIVFAFYYYSYQYRRSKVSSPPVSVWEYVSLSYYRQKGKFYQILFKMPQDRNILFGHLGFVLIRITIFASFLATIHNLCQYYQVPVYDTFRSLVGRPLYVIYALILLAFFYYSYCIWNREYLEARSEWNPEKSSTEE